MANEMILRNGAKVLNGLRVDGGLTVGKQFLKVINNSGSDIPAGSFVQVKSFGAGSPAIGDEIGIQLMTANNTKILGYLETGLLNGASGVCIVKGNMLFDTSASGIQLWDGSPIYYDAVTKLLTSNSTGNMPIGFVVKGNSTIGNGGCIFLDLSASSVNGKAVNTFLDLSDTPGSYAGADNHILVVQGSGGGVAFSGKLFNDGGITTNDIWSAEKILSEINSKVKGLQWQESVIGRKTSAEMDVINVGVLTAGERYLITENWVAGGFSAQDIIEYNGTAWELSYDGHTVGNEGGAVYIDDINSIYVHTSLAGVNSWVLLGPITVPTHNSLLGLQGGAVGEYNHLTNAEYAAVHGKVTLGTANGLSIDPVASPTDNQVLSLALATPSSNGAMSSADYIKLNTQRSVTVTAGGSDNSGKIPRVTAAKSGFIIAYKIHSTTGHNARAGLIMIVVDDTTVVSFTDSSTSDIGDTSTVVFGAVADGGGVTVSITNTGGAVAFDIVFDVIRNF